MYSAWFRNRAAYPIRQWAKWMECNCNHAPAPIPRLNLLLSRYQTDKSAAKHETLLPRIGSRTAGAAIILPRGLLQDPRPARAALFLIGAISDGAAARAPHLGNRTRLAAADFEYEASSALHRVTRRAKINASLKAMAESELKPREKDFPAIAGGEKKALSRNISTVSFFTPLSFPPMIPASASGRNSSAMTSMSG